MTTPTREQVVQWIGQTNIKFDYLCLSEDDSIEYEYFATLARADLEATIAEQAAEIERLKLIEESALKVCSQLDEVVLAIPDCRYMDPPDGGSVSLGEQVKRMWQDVQKWTLATNKNAECIRSQQDQLVEYEIALAAQQAYAEQLRAFIEKWCRFDSLNMNLAEWKAAGRWYRSTQHDTTALQEYGAKLVERVIDSINSAYHGPLAHIPDKIRKGEF